VRVNYSPAYATEITRKRPYKPAFTLTKCFEIMEQERGKHFDPKVLDAFMGSKDQIVEVQIRYSDLDETKS
jgi:putative two-component system response regulator